MRGLAVFDPVKLRPEARQRTVIVEAVVADGVELTSEPGRDLRVPSTARRFEFYYTAPDLSSAPSLRFRHRLEGMDQDWVEPGAERVAIYSQLPPGPYLFRTMVGGPEGRWYENRAPLPLYIVPRWWELRWLQVSSGIALAAGAAGLLVLSERRKLRRRLQLLELQQALEGERRRIARDLHDDLGSRLTEIVLLGELAKRGEQSPGVLQAQLSGLTRKVRELVTAMQEVVWTINPKNDSLGSLATYLGDHTERFLGSAQLSCRLDVAETLPDLPLTANLRHNLLLAFKEALNNAVRHAGATKVRLRIWLADSRLNVAVEDNGCGFDPGKAARQGNGLPNMRNRMDSLGGDMAINSERGKGTTVTFVVPVEAAVATTSEARR
jgi:signal transduction histidine kinase